jgi:hypothetical protein
MMPDVLDKGKTVALPITIDLMKDMTIDNGTPLQKGRRKHFIVPLLLPGCMLVP